MAEADIKIVIIAVVLAVTYGTFLYLNAAANQTDFSVGGVNASQYDTPDSGSFFDTLSEIGSISVDSPELFFINTILFGTIAFILVFIGLRFLRGVG